MTRLLDDARREQMVSLHYTHFMPFRNYTNCQYFFSQNSIVPDIRNYQYGALSTVAVTPMWLLAPVKCSCGMPSTGANGRSHTA